MQRLSIVALAALLAIAASPVFASTFVHTPQHQLVAQADAVIDGTVLSVESFWTPSGRIIVTEATIQVHDTLVGKASSLVTVRTFGGQVDDVRIEAHGFPTFEEGQRLVLFLTQEDGTTRVLGYQEGLFKVVTRRDGVTLAVPQVDEDARYMTRGGRLAPIRESLEINDFKAQVRGMAERAGRFVR